MKKQVTLKSAEINRIIRLLGNLYPEAGHPLQKDIDSVCKLFGVSSGEQALKIASDEYERFLQREHIAWTNNK
jgi:hypothetical protein